MRPFAIVVLSLFVATPATAGESGGPSAEVAPRRVCVTAFELHSFLPAPAVLPGVRVALLPEGDPAAGAAADFPSCAPYADRCGVTDFRTHANGVACFDGVAAGDYFVRTRLDGWWDTRTGPIRVPVRDFDRLDLRVGLDLTWRERHMTVIGQGDHSTENSRSRPIVPPGAPREAPAPIFCISVWEVTERIGELPGATVTLESIGAPANGPTAEGLDEASSARRIGVSDARGVACFSGMPRGRYVATASLDGFWNAAAGPFELYDSRFGGPDLRVGLDVQWAGDLIMNLCDGWPDLYGTGTGTR